MLTQTNMTLSEAQSKVKELFGNDYDNDIWATLCQINDLDPDELEERHGAIAKEVELKLALSKHADLEPPKITEKEYPPMVLDTELAHPTALEQPHEQEHLSQWVESGYGGIATPLGYQIFSIRCFVGYTFLCFTHSLC